MRSGLWPFTWANRPDTHRHRHTAVNGADYADNTAKSFLIAS